MDRIATLVLAVLVALPAQADDKIGIFETIRKSSVSFDDTTRAIEAAMPASGLVLHGSHVIRLRDDAVYFGVTNPYIEDKMVRINSRFRSDGKSDAAPYPGVDHLSALPTDVLVVREGDETSVRHSGRLWRMQLYFWNSGYRAFTANMSVPGAIANSVEATTSP